MALYLLGAGAFLVWDRRALLTSCCLAFYRVDNLRLVIRQHRPQQSHPMDPSIGAGVVCGFNRLVRQAEAEGHGCLQIGGGGRGKPPHEHVSAHAQSLPQLGFQGSLTQIACDYRTTVWIQNVAPTAREEDLVSWFDRNYRDQVDTDENGARRAKLAWDVNALGHNVRNRRRYIKKVNALSKSLAEDPHTPVSKDNVHTAHKCSVTAPASFICGIVW